MKFYPTCPGARLRLTPGSASGRQSQDRRAHRGRPSPGLRPRGRHQPTSRRYALATAPILALRDSPKRVALPGTRGRGAALPRLCVLAPAARPSSTQRQALTGPASTGSPTNPQAVGMLWRQHPFWLCVTLPNALPCQGPRGRLRLPPALCFGTRGRVPYPRLCVLAPVARPSSTQRQALTGPASTELCRTAELVPGQEPGGAASPYPRLCVLEPGGAFLTPGSASGRQSQNPRAHRGRPSPGLRPRHCAEPPNWCRTRNPDPADDRALGERESIADPMSFLNREACWRIAFVGGGVRLYGAKYEAPAGKGWRKESICHESNGEVSQVWTRSTGLWKILRCGPAAGNDPGHALQGEKWLQALRKGKQASFPLRRSTSRVRLEGDCSIAVSCWSPRKRH